MRMIDGETWRAMVTEGALAMEEKKDRANELNVFPVPDGDTGTNMALTMSGAMDAMAGLSGAGLSQAAAETASALLRGARGNSGVILSLLFRGMAKRLKDVEQADGRSVAIALREGVDTAYKAVMKPAEGTILTVSRVGAQHILELCQANPELGADEAFDALVTRCSEALVKTQFQNPVLEKAGVVDAGGFGFVAILEGMRDALKGVKRERRPAATAAPKADFAKLDSGDIRYTYCTEFIAERRDKSKNPDRLRAFLSGLGDSLVLVDDEEIIKVHVHTNEPNRALEEGLKFGPLLTVKVENMRCQHTAKVLEETAQQVPERVIAQPSKPFGFVAVAAGTGLVDIFRDLGADEIVEGGQTMNPSTDDILRAVDKTPAETVYILPNNKNIIMAAQQAAQLSEKKAIVLPCKNIPQGISAMLAFEPDAEEGANTVNMTHALDKVRAGSVTYAARNSDFDGHKIREGDYLALLESRLCANERKRENAVRRLVREMVTKESAFATVIYGEGVTAEDAAKVEALFLKENPGLEITLIDGGQPVYFYILSVE